MKTSCHFSSTRNLFIVKFSATASRKNTVTPPICHLFGIQLESSVCIAKLKQQGDTFIATGDHIHPNPNEEDVLHSVSKLKSRAEAQGVVHTSCYAIVTNGYHDLPDHPMPSLPKPENLAYASKLLPTTALSPLSMDAISVVHDPFCQLIFGELHD